MRTKRSGQGEGWIRSARMREEDGRGLGSGLGSGEGLGLGLGLGAGSAVDYDQSEDVVKGGNQAFRSGRGLDSVG